MIKVEINQNIPPGEIWFINSNKFVVGRLTNVEPVAEEVSVEAIKEGINKILQEKTGWGRIELKQKLFDMLDALAEPVHWFDSFEVDDKPF